MRVIVKRSVQAAGFDPDLYSGHSLRTGLAIAAVGLGLPIYAMRKQTSQLNDFFKCQGFNRFIECAIALAEPQPFDRFTASEIPVWQPYTIAERASALATRHPPSADELARVNDLLGRVRWSSGRDRAAEIKHASPSTAVSGLSPPRQAASDRADDKQR